MERKTIYTQGAGKSYSGDSVGSESGISRPSERGQERLRLVGEALARPAAAGADRSRVAKPEPAVTHGSTTEANRHKHRRRRVTARFYRIVIGAFTLFLLCSYGVAFWRLAMVEQKIRTVRNQISAAEKRNDQLRKDVAKSSSDTYVEEAAREELGLVKPGETAWVVVTPEDPKSPFRVEKRATQGAVADAEGW